MLLNALLFVIAVLFLAIGFRRGVVREVFVTAGVLAGVLLSTYWSRPWGIDFADFFGVSTQTGQYLVSTGFIVGTLFLLGYGAAFAMDLDDGMPSRRVTGALLGLINGVLLFGFLLRDIERFIADEATLRLLRQSAIAWTLLRQPGWILLAATVSLGIVIVVSIVTGRRAIRQAVVTTGGLSSMTSGQAATGLHRRSPRMKWGRDGDKVEPPSTGLFTPGGDPFGQTMPLAPVDGGTWTDRSRSANMSGADWMEIRSDRSPQYASAAVQPEQSKGAMICTGCGERLRERDLYCPRCGRAGNNL